MSPAVEKEFYEVLKCFPMSVEVIAIVHPWEGKITITALATLQVFYFSQNHADSYICQCIKCWKHYFHLKNTSLFSGNKCPEEMILQKLPNQG